MFTRLFPTVEAHKIYNVEYGFVPNKVRASNVADAWFVDNKNLVKLEVESDRFKRMLEHLQELTGEPNILTQYDKLTKDQVAKLPHYAQFGFGKDVPPKKQE